jgi:uncharacterized protein with HEPN domain
MAEAAAARSEASRKVSTRRLCGVTAVHSAVERKFEILGEALGRLARIDPALAARIPEASHIVAFSQFLIHGYAMVEHESGMADHPGVVAQLAEDGHGSSQGAG